MYKKFTKAILFCIAAAMVYYVLNGIGFPVKKFVNFLAEYFMKVMSS